MTDSQGERGLWAAAGEPGNSAMCGARYEAGHLVRHDPDTGGRVCIACGREPGEAGILDQLDGR